MIVSLPKIKPLIYSDISKTDKSFAEISDDLNEIGEKIGCVIKIQREEIFDKMHRL